MRLTTTRGGELGGHSLYCSGTAASLHCNRTPTAQLKSRTFRVLAIARCHWHETIWSNPAKQSTLVHRTWNYLHAGALILPFLYENDLSLFFWRGWLVIREAQLVSMWWALRFVLEDMTDYCRNLCQAKIWIYLYARNGEKVRWNLRQRFRG